MMLGCTATTIINTIVQLIMNTTHDQGTVVLT